MPKNSLENLKTKNGWVITKKILEDLTSGGNFCTRYEVISPEGKTAFLKAMDLSSVAHDLVQVKQLTDCYLFEEYMLKLCAGERMTRVVTPLDTGQIQNPKFAAPFNNVWYIIFEMAEGDLRKTHLDIPKQTRNWLPALIALHHSAVGINQLHKAEIAHQDIKPSNILSFKPNDFKVSDLGRVVDKKGNSPFKDHLFPGDRGYCPIEYNWGLNIKDFSGRLACDMFMVGSLIFHMVEEVQINHAIMERCYQMHPEMSTLDFETSLPFIIRSFYSVLDEFSVNCKNIFGEKIEGILTKAIEEMCNPDPNMRGATKYKNGVARLSLERYIGLLAQAVNVAKLEGIK